MESWYALYVRSSQERVVTTQLEYAGLESFYPHYEEISRDRERRIEQKFFPGYVFVRVDLERRNPSAGIPQIVHIVGLGDQPVIITDSEIESIRILAASKLASLSAPCAVLTEGDLVRVKSGPLRGAEGFVQGNRGRTWLIITLQGLALARAVEVPRDAVERVEAPRKAA